MVIGSPQGGGGGNGAGYVDVYEFTSTAWVKKGNSILGENADEEFGASVDINADGNIIIIGDYIAGKAYVYQFNGTDWILSGSFVGNSIYEQFGKSVSINTDGTVIAIAAVDPGESGHVNVYKNTAGTWEQVGVTINGSSNQDYFGTSVSLSNNGNKVAIGAPQNAGGAGSGNNGFVNVYEYSASSWNIVGSTITGDASDDNFGNSVDLNNDGNTIIIGAPQSSKYVNNPGYVKVLNYSGTDWVQKGTSILGENDYDSFGNSVSIDDDGVFIAIGAPNNSDNGNFSGKTRLYRFQTGDWTQIGGDFNGEGADNMSGYSVSLSSDASTMLIGAPFNSDVEQSSGQVRAYTLCNTTSSFTVEVCSSYTSPSGNYTWVMPGTYNDTIPNAMGCDSIMTITVEFLEPHIDQICMVTFDTISGKNMIIWEKTENVHTARTIIYRESVVAGVYDSIGGKLFSEMSEFIDTDANPMEQAFNYKITNIDSCGNESSLNDCIPHKTIHLQASLGTPNGFQLNWTEYEGYTYLTYNIYGRETNIGNFILVHQSAFGINNWTDGTTVSSMEYKISINKSIPCIPTSSAKTSGGPYSQSVSNIDEYSSVTTSVNDILDENIYLYPNPNTGVFTITGVNIIKIEVININGKTILINDNISEFNNITLSNKGVFFVKIISNKSTIIKKVVIK